MKQGKYCAWVHAYLHRVEATSAMHSYWYRPGEPARRDGRP